MTDKELLKLLYELEKEQKISITGKQRFHYIYKYLKKKPEMKTICDIGGTNGTQLFFKEIYPRSLVEVYNIDEDEIKSNIDFYYLNIEEQDIPRQGYDLIFAGEIVEHLIEPFDAIEKMVRAINNKGLLIITTPNIANIYNRTFLLFGFALGNYHPSMRYRFGNPFLDKGDGIYSGSHKSLFNWKGIVELLQTLEMEVIYKAGFSYHDFQPNINKQNNLFDIPFPMVRKIVNAIMPRGLREGMLLVAKKSGNTK